MKPSARPTAVPYLHREVQAREELGHTAVSPWLAALLTGVFLGLIAAVPLLQPGFEPFRELAQDRPLLDSMNRFEDRLEEESWVVEELLPPVQLFLTGVLGTGNEQVYPGRDGWLFYRPAVDSLTGPGFLETNDPRPALLGLLKEAVKASRRGAEQQLMADGHGSRCAKRLATSQDELIRALYDFAIRHVYPANNPSTSERLSLAWYELVLGVIERGNAAGVFSCERPGETAWMVIALSDAYALHAQTGSLMKRCFHVSFCLF
mgnify:CR=1 FL=1